MASRTSVSRRTGQSQLLTSLLPSGLASIAVHGLILFIMLQTLRGCERGVSSDAGGEEFRTVGLTPLSHSAHEETSLDAPPAEDPAEQQPAETVEQTAVADTAVPQQAPDASQLLNHADASPAAEAMEQPRVIGPGAPLAGLVAPLTQQPSPSGGHITGASPTPGPNAISFENIADNGTRIVYLIDTSGSMHNNGRLDRAANQLKGSLRMLEPHQEFQVIFYGDRPTTMRLRGGAKDLYQANVRNLQLASDEIDAVRLGGSTNHLLALEEGLKLNPEVMYFLTDGKDASLTSGDLSRLLARNRSGARIHVVEFASGAPDSRDVTWLHRLASETGGKYRRIAL